ncbi:MAG: DMT family transporter [Anaerolineae bacterium]|nr:DMT family transporter [Anaerolineae bacterium]
MTDTTVTLTLAQSRNKKLAFLALVVSMILWGVAFAALKVVLRQIGPFTVNVLRFVIALMVLTPFAMREGYRFSIAVRPNFLLYGFTGIFLGFSLQNVGMVFSSAANAALIDAGQAALVVLLSFVILKERLTSKRLLGVLISTAGVLMITLSKESLQSPSSLIGNLFLIAGITAWAVYVIQGKVLVEKHSSLVVTTASFQAGLLFLIPVALLELLLQGVPRMTTGIILPLIYLGIGPSAVAFYLWNYGLRHVDAAVAAPFMNLIPVIGIASAAMIGETISLYQIVGGAVVISGVWLCSK